MKSSHQTLSQENSKLEKIKLMEERKKRWMEQRSAGASTEITTKMADRNRPKYYGSSAEVYSKRSSSDSKAKLKPEASKSKDVVFWTSKNPEAPPEGFVVRNKKKTSARSKCPSDRHSSRSATTDMSISDKDFSRKSSASNLQKGDAMRQSLILPSEEKLMSTPGKNITNDFKANFTQDFSTIGLAENAPNYGNDGNDIRIISNRNTSETELQNEFEEKPLNNKQAKTFSMHCCPHCKQLMYGNDNVPYLIMPCGHNICGQCLAETLRCPTCQVKISSTLENSMLSKVISEHKKQEEVKELMKREEQARKYVGEYDSLNTRCEVLSYKAEGTIESMEQITNDLLQKRTQMKHIEDHGQEIRNQIKDLQEQLNKYEHRYGEYSKECEELELSYQKEKENLDLLENTLQRVKESKERVKTLVQNFIPSFRFQDDV